MMMTKRAVDPWTRIINGTNTKTSFTTYRINNGTNARMNFTTYGTNNGTNKQMYNSTNITNMWNKHKTSNGINNNKTLMTGSPISPSLFDNTKSPEYRSRTSIHVGIHV